MRRCGEEVWCRRGCGVVRRCDVSTVRVGSRIAVSARYVMSVALLAPRDPLASYRHT